MYWRGSSSMKRATFKSFTPLQCDAQGQINSHPLIIWSSLLGAAVAAAERDKVRAGQEAAEPLRYPFRPRLPRPRRLRHAQRQEARRRGVPQCVPPSTTTTTTHRNLAQKKKKPIYPLPFGAHPFFQVVL
jgi:hypothetical protein